MCIYCVDVHGHKKALSILSFVRGSCSSSLSFSPPVPFRPYVSLTLSLPAPVPWSGGVVDVCEWTLVVRETAFVVLCVFPVFLTAVSRQ